MGMKKLINKYNRKMITQEEFNKMRNFSIKY